MIERVVGRFMQHHPEVPILTVHDSLLVPADVVDIGMTAIRVEFASMGLTPSVKQKQRQQQRKAQPRQEQAGDKASTGRGKPTNTNMSSHFAPVRTNACVYGAHA